MVVVGQQALAVPTSPVVPAVLPPRGVVQPNRPHVVGILRWPPSVPVTRYRNSWMTSIEPTMCALNSSSSSAATHSIGAADPPKDRVE